MKIVVVGATGNVGSRTVEAALAAGDQVVAYVRRPEAVTARPGLTIAKGEAGDVGALAAAASGADAVIVSITGPTKDATFMQRTLPKVLEAVKQAGVSRLVLVSAFGAGDTAEKASGFARLIYRTVLGKFFADKAASEKLLDGSGLDYTVAYPVNLKLPRCPRPPSSVSTGSPRCRGCPRCPSGTSRRRWSRSPPIRACRARGC